MSQKADATSLQQPPVAKKASSLSARVSVWGVFADLRSFLGNRTAYLFGVSIALGLLAWSIELMVALSLQKVLVALGIVQRGGISPFSFIGDSTFSALGVFAFLLALKATINWIHSQSNFRMSQMVRYAEQKRVFNWFFSRGDVGAAKLEYFLQNQIANIGNFIWGIQSFILQSLVSIFLIAYLIKMIPVFTLAICGVLALVSILLKGHNRKVRSMGATLDRDSRKISQLRQMNVKNILFLKVTGIEESKKEELLQSYQILFSNSQKFHRFEGMRNVLSQLVAAVIVILIAILGNAVKISTPAAIISYLYLLNRFLQTAVLASANISEINRSRPSFEEYISWWREVQAEEAIKVQKNQNISHLHAVPDSPISPIGWRLKKLTFQYHSSAPPILSEFSLDIPPGTALVISGPSGRGKSTLLRLLLGQIQPSRGEISVLLDDKSFPIEAAKNTVLKNLGYVGPESYLIEGTVLDNLKFGLESQNPSPESVLRALHDAGCDFILRFPDGVHHQITDQGEGLSAGQKQRICLARALLKQPRALILDEATANLDAETERALVDSLIHLRGKVTLIAVTHRPEMLRLALQELHL